MRIDESLPWLGRNDPSWADVQPEMIAIDLLGFVQSHVSILGLIKHSGPPVAGHDPRDDWPHVVDLDGELWVVDGAHRVVGAMLRGSQMVGARVRKWPFDVSSGT